MICRFCGAQMTASATRCGRCGKDVPAKSDCGGFYNIKNRELPQKDKDKEKEKEIPLKDNVDFGGLNQSFRKENHMRIQPPERKKQSSPSLFTLITAAALVLLLILVLMMNGTLRSQTRVLENTVRQVDKLQMDIQALQQLNKQEPPAVLAQQQVTIQVTMDENKITGSCDLGEYADTVSMEADGTQPNQLTLQWKLTDGDITMVISQEKETVVAAVTAAEIFGRFEEEAQYTWQYRSDEQKEWKTVEGLFRQEGGKLTCSDSDLEELKNLELKLILRQTNTDGGVLNVTVEGIVIK